MISIKNKTKYAVLIGMFILALAVIIPIQVSAQNIPVGTCTSPGIPVGCTPSTNPSYQINNPVNVSSIADFIAAVLGIVLKIGIPIVALAIIYSGFVFVSARGNPERLEKAKSRFLYTLIGGGILLGAWMIATIIKATIDALMA